MEPDAIVALASQLLGGGGLLIINGNARTEGRGEPAGEKERSQLLRGVGWSVRVAGRGDEHLVNDPGVIIELLLLLLQGYEFY